MTAWFDTAGVSFQEFSAGGIRTFAIVEGRESGFPLLLLHGIPGASFVWSTTIAAAGRNRRVVAPDLPGWGRSVDRVHPESHTLSRDFLGRWLSGVLTAHNIAECDVVGHGTGAWLALDLLLTHKRRIRRLGLINWTEHAPKTLWPWPRKTWNKRRLQRWLASEAQLSPAARDMVELQLGELIPTGPAPEFALQDYRRDAANYRRALENFHGELLILRGARLPAPDLQNLEQIGLSNSGHFPMFDEPARFTEVVSDFLKD